ncbi:MAG: HEAT repeat domain-containing protein [Deltaproteobacteria bacterium]|nr:MAG: HEAT repeat domain-containing protein [Deltaproteobacteria bacterium]
MTLISLFLLLGLPVLAGPEQDMALASDPDLPVAARQEAFDRIVALGATDIAMVRSLALDEDADTRKRWVAIRALGHIGGAQAEQILVGLLSDPQPAIRAAAVGGLGEIGDRSHTDDVAALLRDPAIIVRAEAATALGAMGDPQAVPALAQALEDPTNYHRGTSLWVRRHYVIALGEIGDKSAVPALLRAMDDPDPIVAAEVVPAFEKIGGFSMGEGRSPEQERDAWRRWASAQIR